MTRRTVLFRHGPWLDTFSSTCAGLVSVHSKLSLDAVTSYSATGVAAAKKKGLSGGGAAISRLPQEPVGLPVQDECRAAYKNARWRIFATNCVAQDKTP